MQAGRHGRAVACAGEKGASGKKSPGIKTQQEKRVVTHGKHREKLSSSPDSTTDKVVVDNNSLSVVLRGGQLAVEGCAKVAACRNALVEKGLGALLGIGVAKTALDNLSSEEQRYVLGVAISGRADLIEKLTPEERVAYDYLIEQDKKGTFSLLTAQQSTSDYKPSSTPNLGKALTDAEKIELGGAGSGTGTPPPPENDPNQQSNKPVQKLNQKQESSIKKIDNLIKNSVKDHDITGTLKDMDGNPIIKPDGSGKYWNYMKEMQDTLNGLRNHANTLKNVNNPEAQAAYGRATDAINKLESAIKGYGI
nr:polymorphic toxin type 28 domain-containing protein [Pantoea stewartii]